MNESSVLEPVEAFDGKSLSVQSTDPLGQVPHGVQIDELDCRYIHADQPGERHHCEFVLGHTLEFA